MKHDASAAILDLEDACARNGMQRPLLLSAVRAFVLAYGDMPQRIAAHLATGEGAALGQAAHRVKGAATLLGAYRLGAAAAALEEAVRAGEAASWPALANAFAAELATVLAAMRELTPEAPVAGATTPAPVSAAVADPARRAARLLRQLPPLLRDGDYAAVALLDQLDALLAGDAHATELATIRQQFDELETEQAALLAERLGVTLG
ncbi:Hpt domain-containing protein [Rugamonas apoptosis]|uniref:Hpt domain-containing protein n=1 Tax=Rugamonas apoptosis TaxID=2758570 RepID=A0A7W2IKT6_9BURK|nr:Hpt domain-containing protein [Rugamonas apoptosis]MBA5687903.1 Hpt domain-containing protein [Rugamonas apoptosis]